VCIAISNALALMSWRDFRFLHGDFMGIGSVWLLIGVLLAFVVISALATEAALILESPHRPRSRARWPVDLSESAIPESPGQANLVGSDTRT
jgi:hypothetical protein